VGGTVLTRLMVRRVVVTALVASALVGLRTDPALAHNSLTSSDPKNGAKVAKPPAAVRLAFLAKLDPKTTKITVTGPDGASATAGAPTFAGSKVTVPLRPGAAGLYTVAWQTRSDDGDIVKGTVKFTAAAGNAVVEPPPATSPPAQPVAEPPPPPAPVAAPAASESGSTSNAALWWLLGGAALVALAVGGFLWRRRSRST
jgi:copper resistance protein C